MSVGDIMGEINGYPVVWSKGRDQRGTPYRETDFYSYNVGIEGGEYDIEIRQYSSNTFITIEDISDGWENYTRGGDGDGVIGGTAGLRFKVTNAEFNANPMKAIDACIARLIGFQFAEL